MKLYYKNNEFIRLYEFNEWGNLLSRPFPVTGLNATEIDRLTEQFELLQRWHLGSIQGDATYAALTRLRHGAPQPRLDDDGVLQEPGPEAVQAYLAARAEVLSLNLDPPVIDQVRVDRANAITLVKNYINDQPWAAAFDESTQLLRYTLARLGAAKTRDGMDQVRLDASMIAAAMEEAINGGRDLLTEIAQVILAMQQTPDDEFMWNTSGTPEAEYIRSQLADPKPDRIKPYRDFVWTGLRQLQ